MNDILEIRPHKGPQEDFLACGSDIALYGGGAGGGKTWAILLDMARWASTVPMFTGVIFRRTYPEIMNPGALWDESLKLLPALGGTPVRSECKWTWANGSWIKFSHLQREEDVHQWQGAQLAAVAFDELTHFSSNQFFYMLSRLRSRCGVRPYLRATCNPDPTSWVAEFLALWIDTEGLPHPAQKPRYMARLGGRLYWADAPEELVAKDARARPMSVSFIPALVTDNPTLLKDDPDYISKLHALTTVDRARLLEGNWKIKAGGGSFFKRQWFKWLPTRPTDANIRWVRYWDRAATEPNEQNNDPDWTRGALIGVDGSRVIIADMAGIRSTPGGTKQYIKSTAEMDTIDIEVALEQDPGQAGVVDIDQLTTALGGFAVRRVMPRGHKADRSKPLSAQCEAGNVYLVRGPWNEDYLKEAEAFLDNREVKEPPGYHDDQIDASDGGYNFLCSIPSPRVRTLQ